MKNNERGVQTNLDHKRRKTKRVPIHQHPPNVSNHRIRRAHDHAAHEPPLFPAEAQVAVDQRGKGVEGNKGPAGCERRPVAVHRGRHRADVEGAVGMRTEDNRVWRRSGDGESGGGHGGGVKIGAGKVGYRSGVEKQRVV